jgi:hypothetical protein
MISPFFSDYGELLITILLLLLLTPRLHLFVGLGADGGLGLGP